MIAPLANVIEPLVFVGFIHLLLGNVLVATVETVAVQRWFGFERRRLWKWALLGNYASALGGFVLLSGICMAAAPLLLGDAPLRHIGRMAVFIPIAAFVLSVLIEWAFFHAALPPAKRSGLRSLGACAVAQVASYAVLLPFYAFFSNNTLGDWTIVHPREIAANSPATVFYLSPDGRIRTVTLAGQPGPDLPYAVGRDDVWQYHLHVAPDPEDQHLELMLYDDPWKERLLGRFPASQQFVAHHETARYEHSYGTDVDLRPEAERRWRYHSSFSASRGLERAWPDDDSLFRHKRVVVLDLLFYSWPVCRAHILPGDQVLFEMNHEIVLADVNTRRLAPLVRGRGQAVALGVNMAEFQAVAPPGRVEPVQRAKQDAAPRSQPATLLTAEAVDGP